MKKLKIIIIGCGYIGQKRSKFINNNSEIIYCIDKNIELAKKLAGEIGCLHTSNLDDLFKISFDAAIVAVPHKYFYEICVKLINANKHILIEKPAALNFEQINKIYKLVKRKKDKLVVHIGYNLRFHDSISKAMSIIKNKHIGDLMYIRARYGHGARVGYNKEWRMKKEISGGGQMIDQGSHLIDLSRFFLGEFNFCYGNLKNYYWKSNVEDNAFIVLENKINKKVAFLHTSCTEWKNIFSFEIFGKKGKILIEGLNGSYGVEKLTLYKMKKKMGIPNIKSFVYPIDNSFKNQQNSFLKSILNKKKINPYSTSLFDALKNLEIIKNIYNKNDYN